MYMLRGLVKEHFLEVCLEQDFKRRGQKRGSKTNYALGSYIRKRENGSYQQKKDIHCSMAKQLLGWNGKGMLGSGNWLSY